MLRRQREMRRVVPKLLMRAQNLRPHWENFLSAMKNTSRRNIYFSALAIPGHILIASSKAVILLFSFSAFMAANVLFTLGLAVIKLLIILAHRRQVRHGPTLNIVQTYRTTGLLVLALAIVYSLSCLPLVFGVNTSDHYDKGVAVAIGLIAFVELVFSVHGLFASRKNNDILMEAVKLSNLAASLILLVLAQTALLSLTADTGVDPITHASSMDPSRYNGLTGVTLGTLAALIGLYMLTQRGKRLIQQG